MKRIPPLLKASAASPFKKPRKTPQAAAGSSQPPTPVRAASQTVLNTAPESESSRMDIKTESDLLYITGKKLYLSEVISDRKLGFEWLKQAAIKGHQQAQNLLGVLYLNSQGVPQDYYQAISWFEKAAVQGNLDAQKNLQIAIESLERKASQEANPEDQYLLGTMYHKGQGFLDQAIEWYKKAADQGHEQAQNHLGTMYHKIQGVLDQAIEWYKKAADQGHKQAQNLLGVIYHKGQGVPQDYYQAISWFEKAAVQGNLDAQKNLQIAIESLERKASQEANPEDQYLLGTMYHKGQGFLDQAIEWYKKAADQGHEQAQNHLGTMYHKIQGVLDQAIEWYKKAADQGHEQAQNHLGLIYLNSQGVPEDYYQAISWFKKAAVQGNLDAQNNLWIAIESLERKAIQEANPEYQYLLGTIYLEGQFIRQNYNQAIEWLHKADNKDHKKAKDLLLATHKSIKERANQESGNHEYQYLLGTMYHKGHGITQDLYQAIKWYKKAAAQGHQAANHFLNILIFQTATPLKPSTPAGFR